jgi:hypothetical protein
MKGEKMNNPNMINPNPQMQQNFNPYQTLPFVLVQDMTMANSYNIGPGGSVIFINQDMSEIRIKAKDASGFSMPDRTWSLTETTPKQAAPSDNYVTKDELKVLTDKIDQLVKQFS